jgi:nucleoside-diphosphate-sugar epimerase
MAFHRFIRAAPAAAPIALYGDGRRTRDFTFVSDAVAATVAAGERVGGRSYNIGGRACRCTMSSASSSVAGHPLTVNREPVQKGDMRDTYADTAAAPGFGISAEGAARRRHQAECRWLSSLPA